MRMDRGARTRMCGPPTLAATATWKTGTRLRRADKRRHCCASTLCKSRACSRVTEDSVRSHAALRQRLSTALDGLAWVCTLARGWTATSLVTVTRFDRARAHRYPPHEFAAHRLRYTDSAGKRSPSVSASQPGPPRHRSPATTRTGPSRSGRRRRNRAPGH